MSTTSIHDVEPWGGGVKCVGNVTICSRPKQEKRLRSSLPARFLVSLGDQSEWRAFKSPASTIAELGRLILDRQSSRRSLKAWTWEMLSPGGP